MLSLFQAGVVSQAFLVRRDLDHLEEDQPGRPEAVSQLGLCPE